MKWHSYTKKVGTGIVKAIYSCNQLSFHHLLQNSKKQKKNKINTVSQVSGLSCKKRKVDETEVYLMKQLSDTDNDIKKLQTESESEDSLYCGSLVPMLEMLPLKKKRLAKIRISQLLYELQFD